MTTKIAKQEKLIADLTEQADRLDIRLVARFDPWEEYGKDMVRVGFDRDMDFNKFTTATDADPTPWPGRHAGFVRDDATGVITSILHVWIPCKQIPALLKRLKDYPE